MARRWHGIALALVLGLASQAAAQQYLPQLYQLALKTEGGSYCAAYPMTAPHTVQTGGWAVQCQSKSRPQVGGFNALVAHGLSFFEPMKTVTSPFALGIRPGSGFPAIVFQDGLVMTVYATPDTPDLEPYTEGNFAFETAPSVAGLNITFGNSGSQLLFLTQLSSTPGGPTKYCRVGPYYYEAENSTTVPGAATENVIVCDQSSWKDATRFTLEPEGWNWNYKRMQLTSVQSGQSCGSRQFTQNDTYLTCNGGDQPGVEDWSDSFFDWLLRKPELPLRTGAEFMVQAWIEYDLPMSVWMTDKAGYVKVPQIDQVKDEYILPSGNKPYFAMVKDEPGSINSTIADGTTVLLRSSANGRYCSVTGQTSRVICTATSKQVAASSNRKKYQFVYSEFIPS